jgi:hypothetical protein
MTTDTDDDTSDIERIIDRAVERGQPDRRLARARRGPPCGASNRCHGMDCRDCDRVV